MTEKHHSQENCAKQVVICDVLPGYPENLVSALADCAGEQAQFHLFHQIERAAEYCAKNPADVLLIAEEFPEEERRKIFAAGVFVLTGENAARQAVRGGAGHTEGDAKSHERKSLRGRPAELPERSLFRYQPADVLWKAIAVYEKDAAETVTFASEDVSPPLHPAENTGMENRTDSAHRGKQSGDESGENPKRRESGPQGKFTYQDDLSGQGPPKELHCRESPPGLSPRAEPQVPERGPAPTAGRTLRGLVAVYSPVHRIGKTKFALLLARQFAEKTPVLYLNLEGCSGAGAGLFSGSGPDLGDLLYYSRQENINFGLKLGTLTEQKGGVDYIRPMQNIQDFYAVKEREWLRLFRKITGKSIYGILILDLGDGTDGLFNILKHCSRIYTPYTDEPSARAKLMQYERTLKDCGYGEILSRTVKKRMSREESD